MASRENPLPSGDGSHIDLTKIGWDEPTSLKSSCTSCHGNDVITQQHLTRAQWDREITKMTNWGAEVKPDDRDKLLDFLSATFKP
jgi:hypothetical protein